MWKKLNDEQKKKYQILITNFASLSEAFTQKHEESNFIVTPIVNSKFQETVFQKAFNATGEDIANTSYDASLITDNNSKFLVGIKSFGFSSGDQKVAQFKKNSQKDNWGEIFSQIIQNAKNENSLEIVNKINNSLYLKLAKNIAQLRNDRIASSKAQIKGFCGTENYITAVYHVLMATKHNNKPQIFVGETSYSEIDIENITVLGATSLKTPTNFKFTDGIHNYKYTSADSQLLMSFNNKDIIVETWDVKYVDDPIKIFENLHEHLPSEKELDYEQTVSWMLHDENGFVEENSSFNAFNGASKLPKDNHIREKRILKIKEKYKEIINKQDILLIDTLLKDILLKEINTKEKKSAMKLSRTKLIKLVYSLNNNDLIYDIEQMVYRPTKEMYIKIPNSKIFHVNNPDFFGENIGKLNEKSKLQLPKNERTFRLEFLASGDSITAYINQQSGKAIQSYGDQQVLGSWILEEVFQLQPREILTGKRLEELGINAIRLYKFKDSSRGIGLEFTWIDTDNPPNDAIGWVQKK